MMSQHKPNADEKQHCLMGTSGSRKKDHPVHIENPAIFYL